MLFLCLFLCTVRLPSIPLCNGLIFFMLQLTTCYELV